MFPSVLLPLGSLVVPEGRIELTTEGLPREAGGLIFHQAGDRVLFRRAMGFGRGRGMYFGRLVRRIEYRRAGG